MTRSAFSVVLCLVLGSVHAAAAKVYSNYDYGFAVNVPDGLAVEYSEPPAPNHGFLMTLGGDRTLGVFAYYDTTETRSAMTALRERLSFDHWNPRTNAVTRRSSLAGLPAASVDIALGRRRALRTVAFRAHGHEVGVIYYFALDTDAAHGNHDRGVFRSMVRSLTLLSLPN